jgi:methylated-DNA-[protein]-cysteine S-methyltransferase
VRAVRTQYAVAGWGEGELWTADGLVLAHDFRFEPAAARVAVSAGPRTAAALGAAPVAREAATPVGEARPPSGTVDAKPAQVSHDIVRTRRQSGAATVVDPRALAERLAEYLAGVDVELADVPLDLAYSTPFQHEVTAALRAVPRGEVVTYGELAAIAGHPRAGRAVGTVCATNRFMFLVPCHRVVASNGIGGYGSAGVGVKRRLLALEGIVL